MPPGATSPHEPASQAPAFCIRTLGCKVNRAESEAIAVALVAAGWRMQEDPAGAHLAIVNTCTVTGEADRKNRKLIRRLLKDAPDAPVLVCGCAVNVDADFYRDIDARVVCEADKERIVERAAELLARAGEDGERRQAKVERVVRGEGRQTTAQGEDPRASGQGERPHAPKQGEGPAALAALRGAGMLRTRADLKIQDGCDNACTFCIVHVARGPARSTPAAQVLEQARVLVAAGAREIVLVGIDLAAWREGAHGLAWLVGELLKKTGVDRLRISSIEPQNLDAALVEAFAAHSGRLARHAHLCLQSGSDKVLREMARHYSSAGFLEQVKELRRRVPSVALSTDVIVGFPGESDEDFEQTCALVESCAFMRLHVFRYSARPGTPAAARADQVDAQVAAARAAHLQELGERLAAADRAARVDSEELVLVEGSGRGTSESYHTVLLDGSAAAGQLVPVRFTDVDEKAGALVGKPLA